MDNLKALVGGQGINKNEVIGKILKNKEYNKTLTEYYIQLSEELQVNFNGNRKKEQVENCNSFWALDHYKKSKVKDIKSTNLCRDRYCSNCKKVKQSAQIVKYMDILDKDRDNLYLFTFTIPNIKLSNLPNYDGLLSNIDIPLKNAINKLNLAFKKFIRILNGNLKCNFFPDLGYLGSIKSIEITYNKKTQEFHPHIHAIFNLKNCILEGKNINKYSYNYKNDVITKFTDLEIILQKLWKLLISGQYLTKNRFENLELGYTCKIDKVNDKNVFEVFKYNIKDTDLLENGYSVFRDIYIASFRKKFIQGYGCYYKVQEVKNKEIDQFYDNLIKYLQSIEDPLKINEAIENILEDNESIYISRGKIKDILKSINVINK